MKTIQANCISPEVAREICSVGVFPEYTPASPDPIQGIGCKFLLGGPLTGQLVVVVGETDLAGFREAVAVSDLPEQLKVMLILDPMTNTRFWKISTD
jgi:hypothetical protein